MKNSKQPFDASRRLLGLVKKKADGLPTGLSEHDDAMLGYVIKYLNKVA